MPGTESVELDRETWRRTFYEAINELTHSILQDIFRSGSLEAYLDAQEFFLGILREDAFSKQRKTLANLLTPEHIHASIRDIDSGSMVAKEFILEILRNDLFSTHHETILKFLLDYAARGSPYAQHLLAEILRDNAFSKIHRILSDIFTPSHLQMLLDYAARDEGTAPYLLAQILGNRALSKQHRTIADLLTPNHIKAFFDNALRGFHNAQDIFAEILRNKAFSKHRQYIANLFTPEHVHTLLKYAEWGFEGAQNILLEMLRNDAFSSYHKTILEGVFNRAFERGVQHLLAEILCDNTIYRNHNEYLGAILRVFISRVVEDHGLFDEGSPSQIAREVLSEVFRHPAILHVHTTVADILNDEEFFSRLPKTRYLVSFLYEAYRKTKDMRLPKRIEDVMQYLYGKWVGISPPRPGHPPNLPLELRHDAFKNRVIEKGMKVKISEDVRETLRALGFSHVTLANIHNIIDSLTVHRDEIIEKLTANLSPEEKKKKAEELSVLIDDVLPRLRELASRMGTKRVILDFYLRATPKDPISWVGARIKASNDCTVPSSPHPGFEEHTVPMYFSSNGVNYEIRATHLDRKSGRKGKLGIRRNRHVGNVYIATYTTDDGRKILYVHGVQLGSIYRGRENVGIARGLLKGLVDMARDNGFHEVWIQTRDLSNYGELQDALIDTFKRMGGEKVPKSEIERLNYGDLPKRHYASPHRVGYNNLLRLRIREV